MHVTSLWGSIASRPPSTKIALHGRGRSVAIGDLSGASCLCGRFEALRGRSVLLALREQLDAAIALIELDGIARRIVLCTPDLTPERLAEVAKIAEIDAVVSDSASSITRERTAIDVLVTPQPIPERLDRRATTDSEWILLTSGTTGGPKLVVHTLQSLAGTLPRQESAPTVWSTFYDIRRYGGLQIYLRALLGGSPLVLSSSDEPTAAFLARAGAAGVTHISGTPSHWRRVLMSGQASSLEPRYVRLSGEIADQPLLDQLHAAYPMAVIAHAFASTEAGVAFDVNDGLAGFPAAYIEAERGDPSLKVIDGTLRIRSRRTAARYLGEAAPSLCGVDGYVDTGDLVELVEDRYYFRGRKGGIINVGGLKVYPEEVEAVLNSDSRVRMSLVRARRNPITGAVVAADVLLADRNSDLDGEAAEALKRDLIDACRRALPAHKVPAILRIVPALEVTAAGKLVRPDA